MNTGDAAELKPQRERSDLETLIDGTMMNVDFRAAEGSVAPESQRVRVRKISIRDMDQLCSAVGKFKMDQEVALYLGFKLDQVETLTDKSFEAAMEEGRRLNFHLFGKWWAWRSQTLEAMGQMDTVHEAVKAAIERETKSWGSGRS